ncbi:MAG: N4-gp56 family major capsid protein [Clostridia bacterium]|nr:N4-gp56 family major capsid protein [Clostridia bacterium]
MAINYASKYAAKIDERFSREALSAAAINNDYDFVGTKTVNVYSVPTATMNNYQRTGSNRYGTPAELENSVQEMTVSKDRSFTFTIDRGNFNDTQMANNAGEALSRQIREVVIPEIDKYRFGVICSNAGKTVEKVLSNQNAYDAFLDATTEMIENNVLLSECVAFVSSKFYKYIKEDNAFIKNGDLSQKMLIKGQVGEVDGVAIVVVPTAYLPENVAFVLTHKSATVAPVKLSEYKIHDNPPGINGWLVEGRVYYDAFVLDNKAAAIYVHMDTEPEEESGS